MKINIFNIEQLVKTSEFSRLMRTEKRPSVILGMIYFEDNWNEDKEMLTSMGIAKKEMRKNCYKRLKRDPWISEEQAELVLLRNYGIKMNRA
ncbi:hypothetical protein [Bacillus wiedmannii]|uniref:hypothetical protein n=1 Tax=Bacillus wiedmannii TaxID=1890302 RepID=UPI000BF0ACF3|nr:hypothetical protein [Bacillus wiedmannii]PEL63774.1 hypothetical protein CN622_08830 [Bacillus wiedmannii]